MLSFRTSLLVILGFNALAILIIAFNIGSFKRNTLEEEVQLFDLDMEDMKYRFENPAKAAQILEQLDVFSTMPRNFVRGTNFTAFSSGLKVNNNYCSEHRTLFVNHPELVFEEMNIFTNFYKSHKLRSQVIPDMKAVDVHPEIALTRKWIGDEYTRDLKRNINIFYTTNLFFYRRQVGKQFSCLSQASNHIPGHDNMYRKDRVGQSLVNYVRGYESRPQCFGYNKYFPKTWILQEKDQCLEFFEEFNSEKYQQLKKERNIVYFRKIGADVHEGKGVFPVNDQEETYIQELYKNGTLCGEVKKNNLIQYNVHNLLLVENRKFGFRMFLLVASTNPVIAYYHDGYARTSLNEYDPNSKEVITFVTNIGLNIKEAEKDTGLTEEQIQESTLWFLEDFHNYLFQKGRITDPNWLDNYLRPEMKKVMIHLIRLAQSGFFQTSSVFELFGLDFVMDENYELWFIEANTMPLIDGFTARSTKMFNKMLVDTFEIVSGLLKSRMKRVIKYINMISKEVNEVGEIPNVDERREEFKELSKNFFEPEFEPSPENRYHKIIDENEHGTKRYSHLISEECL